MKRLSIHVLFLLATVGCFEQEDDGPCGGCASPHPRTETSGGTTTAVSGSADVRHDHGLSTFTCTGDTYCSWSGSRIEISSKVPRDWLLPDAGVDADAGEDADAGTDADAGEDADTDDEADAAADAATDADADADAPDGTTGIPRGWDEHGRVAFIDLGTTPLDQSSPLAGARLVWCGDRHETLVATEDGELACASGSIRPPRIEPLTGRLLFRQSMNGETSMTTSEIEGKTSSGLRITLAVTVTSSPVRSREVLDCY